MHRLPSLLGVTTVPAPGGGNRLVMDFLGMPGQTATLDTTSDLEGWNPFSTEAADASGLIRFTPPQDGFHTFHRRR